MKILVTGSSGFIANHIINYLIDNFEHEIIVTSRDFDKISKKNWFNKVKFIEADLTSDKRDWFSFFDKPNLLIHLAWDGLPNYNSNHHLTQNLVSDIKFLENIVENGLKTLVVTGTCFEYGLQSGELSEEDEAQPQNFYSIAKDTLRKYLQIITPRFNCKLKWLRLFYMYGEGQNPNSLFSQLNSAIENGEKYFCMSGGEQIRDYLPVEEISRLIVKISLDDTLEGVFNVSSGTPVKLKSIVENYLMIIGKTIDIKYGSIPYSSLEPMEFWGSNKKIKHL